jgi:hypothetical protein
MGLLGNKHKFDALTLAQLHSAPPPEWCMRMMDRKLRVENSGVIPYTLRSKSFFGPNLESWFLTLLTKTLTAAEHDGKDYTFLLQQYIALLTGLRDILACGWDAWQNDEAGKPQALTHNPFSGDPWDMLSINFLWGSLKFLKKAAELHNLLLANARVAAAPWNPGFLDYQVAFDNVSRGVLVRTRHTVTIRATPAVLAREMDRLSGRGSGPAIPDA